MKKLRIVVDLLMVFLLPLLMGYSLVGELYHEIAGVLSGLLFAAHIAINRKWFASALKGSYNIRRVFMTIINLFLLICVLASMISGIFLSKYLFRFLGISALSSFMRTLHMLAAYWGLLLMSFHAGTHGVMIVSRLRKRHIKHTISAAFLLISAYGIFAFIKRGFPDFLFGRVMFVFFDFSEPFIFYYLDYLSVMILFMTLGFLTNKLLSNRLKRRETGRKSLEH